MRAHWLLGDAGQLGEEVPAATLRENGLVYQALDTHPDAYQGVLDALKAERGYAAQREVVLGPETPELEQICAECGAEHFYEEDEARFVLAGGCTVDIRSHDDRWMRIEMVKGDLIIVPARRYHRVLLPAERRVRWVRLSKDRRSSVPHYRRDRQAS